MAKSAAQKLFIKPGTTVWVSHADRRHLIDPLPEGVTSSKTLGAADVAVVFGDDEASVRKLLTKHAKDLTKAGILWVAYPKGNRVDINRDKLWPILGEFGLRANMQVAIDDTWSALRFRPLAPGEATAPGSKTA
ncbi:MAG TPA: hypothetical protein VFC19_15030 [Candidatus Limnocylindrales bacterium]|nr:hypothetical protein [Candidatus Limnocylindrales bacterium]